MTPFDALLVCIAIPVGLGIGVGIQVLVMWLGYRVIAWLRKCS